jgi:hypothetical protein
MYHLLHRSQAYAKHPFILSAKLIWAFVANIVGGFAHTFACEQLRSCCIQP